MCRRQTCCAKTVPVLKEMGDPMPHRGRVRGLAEPAPVAEQSLNAADFRENSAKNSPSEQRNGEPTTGGTY